MELITEKLIKYLETTETFVAEHAPDYIQQLLEYEFLSSILCLTGIAALAIVVILWGRSMHSRDSEGVNISEGEVIPFFFTVMIIVIVGIMTGVNSVDTLVKIKVAPKVFIMDKLRGE